MRRAHGKYRAWGFPRYSVSDALEKKSSQGAVGTGCHDDEIHLFLAGGFDYLFDDIAQRDFLPQRRELTDFL